MRSKFKREHQRCSKCGNIIAGSGDFCNKCGYSLNEVNKEYTNHEKVKKFL